MSLPVWGRGLKSEQAKIVNIPASVAPRVGAWIEIDDKEKYYAGRGGRSPSGGRGLKFVPKRRGMFCASVAPHMGAWIELTAI